MTAPLTHLGSLALLALVILAVALVVAIVRQLIRVEPDADQSGFGWPPVDSSKSPDEPSLAELARLRCEQLYRELGPWWG